MVSPTFLYVFTTTSFRAEPCGAWYDINHQMVFASFSGVKVGLVTAVKAWDTVSVICWQSNHSIRKKKQKKTRSALNKQIFNSDEWPWETVQGQKVLRTGKTMFICNHICDNVWQHSSENSHCCAQTAYSTKFQLFISLAFSLQETQQVWGKLPLRIT